MNAASESGTDPSTPEGSSSPDIYRYTVAGIVLILVITFSLFAIRGGWNDVISRLTDSRDKPNSTTKNATVPTPPNAYVNLDPPERNTKPLRTGKQIYSDHCQACHGENGAGDGPVSSGLTPEPRAFSPTYLDRVTDQYLFWRISEGKPETAMPAFKQVLSRDQRWSVIHYVHTLAQRRK